MERLRGCFNGYGGPLFPSKADRIMSRYRPIAPKPAMPCVSEVERSASSAVTIDNLCIRQAPVAPSTSTTSRQKSKRARKRAGKDSDVLVQPAKKAALDPPPNQVCDKPQSLNAIGCCSAVGQIATTPIQEDAGFMERAAANATPSVFSLERLRSKAVPSGSYPYGGCFTELIRGIAGLPTANHVHNLLQSQHQQHQSEQAQPQLSSVIIVSPQQFSVDEISTQQRIEPHREESPRKTFSRSGFCGDAVWSCVSEVAQRGSGHDRSISEDAEQSGLDEEAVDVAAEQSKGTVTLNLFRELPIRVHSPSMSSSSCESSHVDGYGSGLACIEQVYGHSPEPVILTESSTHNLLWANQAYIRACQENSHMLAPFIDPLGLPTQLGQFQLQLEGRGECTPTTLWGFLKKFVLDMTNYDRPKWLSTISGDAQSGSKQESGRMLSSCRQQAPIANKIECPSVSSAAVITPQPVRLVGSVVRVESVSEIQIGNAVEDSMESAKRQLEESSLPGLVTDASNTVRWVNTAYKIMVGQPECPWLASTMKEEDRTSSTITGEVLLSCNAEIPLTASTFSCRANVQWTRNTGERTCMTLPCDVAAFTDGHLKRMLVWRFDIQASLSLSCGADRFA